MFFLIRKDLFNFNFDIIRSFFIEYFVIKRQKEKIKTNMTEINNNDDNSNLSQTKNVLLNSFKNSTKKNVDELDTDFNDFLHKTLYDIYNSEINKSLFLCLIELIASVTGDNFNKLCSKFDVRNTEIGSLSIISGKKVYALSFIIVDPIYRHNLGVTRNNLLNEADKYQFTSIIVKATELLKNYYSSLQYFHPKIFNIFKNRLNSSEFMLLKMNRFDNFYLTENGKQLGYLITEMNKSVTDNIIRTAINANEVI